MVIKYFHGQQDLTLLKKCRNFVNSCKLWPWNHSWFKISMTDILSSGSFFNSKFKTSSSGRHLFVRISNVQVSCLLLNGNLPFIITNKIIPKHQESTLRGSHSWPCKTSGGRYWTVPDLTSTLSPGLEK